MPHSQLSDGPVLHIVFELPPATIVDIAVFVTNQASAHFPLCDQTVILPYM